MNTNDLINSVRKESNTYGSIPFWSWNDKLEEDELRRQIGRMDDLGMHGFFMHARGGLSTIIRRRLKSGSLKKIREVRHKNG